MRLSFRGVATAGFLFLIAFAGPVVGFGRERGPRVEVRCPFPPIPVTIDQQKVLVYELHVTNFDTVPLTLQSVEIFADGNGSDPLASLADKKLSSAMTRA